MSKDEKQRGLQLNLHVAEKRLGARGLGSAWTCLHLLFEEEAAQVLGIPYAEVTQACLIPVAHTKGTDFRPGWREPLESVMHWDAW